MPDITQDPKQKEEIKKVVEEVIQEHEQKQNGGGEEQDPEKKKNTKAIVDCVNAKNICLQTARYGLTQGGNMANVENISKFQDCAEICEALSGVLIRESELKSDLAQVCGKACEAC